MMVRFILLVFISSSLFPVFIFADTQDKLIRQLKSNDVSKRREAAERLGQEGDKAAVKPLIKALKDKEPNVRISAAFSLGELGDQAAVKHLIRLVKKDDKARAMGIRALGNLKNPKAIPTLETFLLDTDPITVVESALALSHFDGKKVELAFIRALKTSDDYGCQAITNILGKKHIKAATPALIDEIKNPFIRPNCALAATESLGLIDSPEAIQPLIRLLDQRHPIKLQTTALRALGKQQAVEAYSEILPLLEHQATQVRVAAVEALVGLRNTDAIPVLRKKLEDPSPEVREVARYAMGQFGQLLQSGR